MYNLMEKLKINKKVGLIGPLKNLYQSIAQMK